MSFFYPNCKKQLIDRDKLDKKNLYLTLYQSYYKLLFNTNLLYFFLSLRYQR